MSSQSNLLSINSKESKQKHSQRYVQIHFDPQKCTGCLQCYEVCPVGCWLPQQAGQAALFQKPEVCIACSACVLQCPENAIQLQ